MKNMRLKRFIFPILVIKLNKINKYMMKVINSNILLKVEKGATMKIGGLEVPADAREYEVGNVYSVGEKVEGIKEGDKIYFYSGSGKRFTQDGEEYRVINSSEVIVVL